MTHPLVTQLRFARSEFVRCLEGVSAEDGGRRLRPLNSLSWMVGHLASQEHGFWVKAAQDRDVAPGLRERVGYGRPDDSPPWEEMWQHWHNVTGASDQYLDTLTDEMLQRELVRDGTWSQDVGISLLRNIYHYWYHLGQAHAVREMLGHGDLPQFVGGMSAVRHSVAEKP